MKIKLAGALLALALAGCGNASPVLKTEIGDGTWEAGHDMRYGTWSAANTGIKGVTCEWTVTKKSNQGTVLLRSHDTDHAIQTVYVAGGEVLKTNGCGTWGWLTFDNVTKSPEAK